MPVLLIVYSAGLDRELHARFVVIENIVAEVFVVGVNIGQIEIRMTETVPQAGRIILVRFDRRIVRRSGIHIRFGAISIRGVPGAEIKVLQRGQLQAGAEVVSSLIHISDHVFRVFFRVPVTRVS